MKAKRVFLIVLDSYGIGELPDAYLFHDEGSNTLASIVKSKEYNTPVMRKMGLFNIDGVTCANGVDNTIASYARIVEKSMGKDTTIGHWEISGVISEKALPTYPDGFPDEVLEKFSKATNRKCLCNKPYSGTAVINDFGNEHVNSGDLIIYTSADSVFQIAAHEDIVPLETLYEYCKIAREILKDEHGVGRVIARPFIGTYPDFKRTSHRHDFSLIPPKPTMLDSLQENGFNTIGIGKIYDIFAGKGIEKTQSINNNTDGMEKTIRLLNEDFTGLCFVNLVDFDMLYGHRNDIDGYARAATEFDKQLDIFINNMNEDDILIITADHGCDPGTPSTDHSREYTPMIIYGSRIKENVSLGTRETFADIGATVLDIFDIKSNISGTSFLSEVLK